MLSKIHVLVAVIAVSTLNQPASAQAGGDALLYGRALFKGPETTISGPTRSMGGIVVKSLQIPPGSIWELCIGNTFTGCARFSQSKRAMVMTVRSARPVAPPIPASASAAFSSVKGSDVSLRGLASEFFVLPQINGNRIEVGGRGSASASALAAGFCKTHGWQESAYEREQTIEGREYLADVLCSDQRR